MVTPESKSAESTERNDNSRFVAGIVQQLDSLRLAGVQSLPLVELPTPSATVADPSEASPTIDNSPQDTQNEPNMPPTKSKIAASEALRIVAEEVAGCTQCAELSANRNKTVFGTGNPNARLCFLGEAPGADEDKTGEPFVGRAGQLLTKIIEACTLTRDEVYILNMLKCRPPGNRNPLPDEVANCNGYLKRQLDIIQPEFICCLGAVAAKNLLDSELTIGKLRGRFHNWNGIKVLATYHPAYLLRNPPAKAEVWKDMQFLMNEMGIELPGTQS